MDFSSSSFFSSSSLIFLIPVISAFIGWITNFFAIKMLFHPRRKFKMVFFSIQGIIPANQNQIAERLSHTIFSSLLSEEDLKQKIIDQKEIDQIILKEIDDYVENFLKTKLVKAIPLASMFISDDLIQKAKQILLRDLKDKIPDFKKNLLEKTLEKLDLQTFIKEKIKSFSLEELENVLMGILRKEFKFIEFIGAIVGFLIGLLQVTIFYL